MVEAQSADCNSLSEAITARALAGFVGGLALGNFVFDLEHRSGVSMYSAMGIRRGRYEL
jgi:hypothetical protein